MEGVSSYMFGMFLLSRGVYDMKKHVLQEYYSLIMDVTEEEYVESWMELDRVYLFNQKAMKPDPANPMVPYDLMLDVIGVRAMELVDASRFCIRLDYDERIDLLVFENVTEVLKFYNYFSVLHANAVERQNSLGYNIALNLRILFDDTRFSSMESVFMVVVENYNIKYNRRMAEKLKIAIDDKQVDFKATTEFYDIVLTAYYSMVEHRSTHDKLKVFINCFHGMYFDTIRAILNNQYTEVG